MVHMVKNSPLSLPGMQIKTVIKAGHRVRKLGVPRTQLLESHGCSQSRDMKRYLDFEAPLAWIKREEKVYTVNSQMEATMFFCSPGIGCNAWLPVASQQSSTNEEMMEK